MEIPKTKVLIYVLTFLGYAFSGYGSAVIENLRDAVILAEEYFSHFFENAISFVKKIGEAKRILHASDDNCEFSCASGGAPVKNKYHKPSFNGCGTDLLSLQISKYLPTADMKECCNQHDLCYDTCNTRKKDCDEEFKYCLYKICNKITTLESLMKACKVAASMVSGSMSLGCQSYLDSQKKSCYCPFDDKKKKYVPGGASIAMNLQGITTQRRVDLMLKLLDLPYILCFLIIGANVFLSCVHVFLKYVLQ